MDKNLFKYLRKSTNSWRVDETYIKINGKWAYLYRAVDSVGDTIAFYLSKNRNNRATKHFLKKSFKNF